MKFRYMLFYSLVCLCLTQAPLAIYAADQGNYDVKVLSYKDNSKLVVLKYDKFNGETWALGKTGWKKIPDKEPIGSSVYKIEITPLFKENWFATRIDTKTGKTWKIVDGAWVEY